MPGLTKQWSIVACCLLLASGQVFAVRPTPDAVIVFAAETDSVPDADNLTLEQLSSKAKSDPGNWINLEAYANDLGSRELNLALAQRRIDNVSHRLAMLGIPLHRIRGISYRDQRISDEDLPMRRVEIRIQKLGL